MIRMTKGGISEQWADCGKPSVAGARAIFPLVLKVVEEGTDQRGIKIADVAAALRQAFLQSDLAAARGATAMSPTSSVPGCPSWPRQWTRASTTSWPTWTFRPSTAPSCIQ